MTSSRFHVPPCLCRRYRWIGAARRICGPSRARLSFKRGGRNQRVVHSSAVNFDEFPDFGSGRSAELIALDDGLNELAQIDPRKVRIVELRFFSGLSVEEIANVLKVSPQTVMRDWKLAEVWLKRELARR
jgi:RNA polymerase sigma-70 factor, ECF subfamily